LLLPTNEKYEQVSVNDWAMNDSAMCYIRHRHCFLLFCYIHSNAVHQFNAYSTNE